MNHHTQTFTGSLWKKDLPRTCSFALAQSIVGILPLIVIVKSDHTTNYLQCRTSVSMSEKGTWEAVPPGPSVRINQQTFEGPRKIAAPKCNLHLYLALKK
jgi:hypothetical protein